MVRAKNHKHVSTFVEVMQKKTVASFFSGHGVDQDVSIETTALVTKYPTRSEISNICTALVLTKALCSWERNRRSGDTLAMHHRLSGIATYRLNGLERKMSNLCSGGSWHWRLTENGFYFFDHKIRRAEKQISFFRRKINEHEKYISHWTIKNSMTYAISCHLTVYITNLIHVK